MFILPQKYLEGMRMLDPLEGGRRSSLGKQPPPHREQISQFPLAQQGMGLSHLGEVGKPVRVAGGSLRKARMVYLWDRYSKSVNTPEPLLCSQPNKRQEITVRAPQIWLFRTQIFWLIKPRISVS